MASSVPVQKKKKQMTPAQLAVQIKNMVLEFIADLRDNVFEGKESSSLVKVDWFFRNFDSDGVKVSGKIVELVLPHKKMIQERNVTFFLENRNKIFEGVEQVHIDKFSGYLTKSPKDGGISAKSLQTVWKYFDCFVALAEVFKKFE